MKFLDFNYDGINLSDFGFIACAFEPSQGLNTVSAGSKLSFTKVSRDSGRQNTLVNSEYGDCLTATFDICKNPDIYAAQNEMVIKQDEYRNIMRWLNRRKYCKFRVIPFNCYDSYNNSVIETRGETAEYSNGVLTIIDATYDVTQPVNIDSLLISEERRIDTCYYNASFNVDQLRVAEDIVGLRLTMETDKPFGYGNEVSVKLPFSYNKTAHTVYDVSDEVGDFCPDVIITVNSAGNLNLVNTTLGVRTSIKNCTAGEVITMKGKEQIILTTVNNHDICNDFNYEYLKIGNSYSDRANVITCDLPCDVTLAYEPVVKDVL